MTTLDRFHCISRMKLSIPFQACKTCDTFGSTSCSTEGEDGPGVADADFVVYVAARDFNCVGNTLAYAAHCFQDRSTDRYLYILLALHNTYSGGGGGGGGGGGVE